MSLQMHRLTVANNKGGVGKTLLATSLARKLAAHGRKVLFIDLDVQGNGSYALQRFWPAEPFKAWDLLAGPLTARQIELAVPQRDLQLRSADPAGGLCAASASADLVKDFDRTAAMQQFELNIARLNTKFDTLVIDTPPTLADIFVFALGVSRDVLIPLEAAVFSFMGLKQLLRTINNLKNAGINPDLKILGLVYNRLQGTAPRQQEISKTYGEQIGKLLLDTPLHARDSFAEALEKQIDLQLIAKTAAAPAKAELNALYRKISATMR